MMPGDPIVGGTALRRPAIQSPNFVTGVSGWTINADGSVEFNNGTFRGTVTAGTIIGSLIESATSGRRLTIDANGDIKAYNAFGAVLLWFVNSKDAFFIYADTGSAAQGALVSSIANSGGTDPFGATYLNGNVTYVTIAGQTYGIAIGEPLSQSIPAMIFHNITTPPALDEPFIGAGQPASGSQLVAGSGSTSVAGSEAATTWADSVNSGVAGGTIHDQAGQVLFGILGAAKWDDNASSFTLPAGGGPFILGETFHQLAQPANTTNLISTPGSCSGRIKLLPWNMVQLEVQFTINAGNVNTTFTLGAGPSGLYQPVDDRRFPCSCTAAVDARLFVPHSGGPQVIISAAAAGATVGAAVMYANN